MKIILLTLISTIVFNGFSQTLVNYIASDYSGFWSSTHTTAKTTPRPDTSHNLLAFRLSTGSTIYSTGVNDALLTSRGVTYSPQLFKALPVNSTPNSGIIAVGSRIPDASVVNNIPKYLTDGINGLNLGTAWFNGDGKSSYSVASITATGVTDGVPDIIVPQVGAVGGVDSFWFENSTNKVVGNKIGLNFGSIDSVAMASWKYYDVLPSFTGAFYTSNLRAVRMAAFFLSNFGITLGNYTTVRRFVHKLSKEADQPFVAYNAGSIALPATFSLFDVRKEENKSLLSFQISGNQAFDLVIQKSNDYENWENIAKLNNVAPNKLHQFEDGLAEKGYTYYRIGSKNENNTYDYSVVKALNHTSEITSFNVTQNLDLGILELDMALAYTLTDINGKILNAGLSKKVDVAKLDYGIYFLNTELGTKKVIISN